MTAGIIIRNNQGLVMGACVYPRENVYDATTAEAFACRKVVIFTAEMGFRDAEFE